jgi:peroxiredoxin Q/BCP
VVKWKKQSQGRKEKEGIDMTAIGQAAPAFTLQANNNQTISLSQYRGKNVVLYFYPKDMTPGCTTEACEFRDYHPKFSQLDTEHQVAEAYGVWKLKKMYGREYMGIERTTFVIDKQGNVAKVWPKVKVKGHVQEVLQFIEEQLQ